MKGTLINLLILVMAAWLFSEIYGGGKHFVLGVSNAIEQATGAAR